MKQRIDQVSCRNNERQICYCGLLHWLIVKAELGLDPTPVVPHTLNSIALARILEFLLNSRSWVLISSSRFDNTGYLLPFFKLELVLNFLLSLEQHGNLYKGISIFPWAYITHR